MDSELRRHAVESERAVSVLSDLAGINAIYSIGYIPDNEGVDCIE